MKALTAVLVVGLLLSTSAVAGGKVVCWDGSVVKRERDCPKRPSPPPVPNPHCDWTILPICDPGPEPDPVE